MVKVRNRQSTRKIIGNFLADFALLGSKTLFERKKKAIWNLAGFELEQANCKIETTYYNSIYEVKPVIHHLNI